MGDPEAESLVERILERARAGLDRHDPCAQQVHPVDVLLLPLDIERAHVDHAFEAMPGSDGGGGHAVLAGPGLGDDPLLAHAPCQQCLADGVVDLVGAGMVEILALQIDLRPAQLLRPSLRVIDRAGTADEMPQFLLVLGQEIRIVAIVEIGIAQFGQGPHQGLGREDPAIGTKMPVCIRQVVGSRHQRFRSVAAACAARRSLSACATAATKPSILTTSFARGLLA